VVSAGGCVFEFVYDTAPFALFVEDIYIQFVIRHYYGTAASRFQFPFVYEFVYVEFDNRTSGNIKYQLMDMSGRVIQSSSEKLISNRIEIHVSGIPEGNYLLKINTDSEEISRKIIVSHR
jgi:hypothetical protein